MKRFLLVLAVMGAGACNKPSADECRQAINNMEKLLGTDSAGRSGDIQGEIRRCQGGSSREAVTCAMKAATVAELKACTFMTPKSKQ